MGRMKRFIGVVIGRVFPVTSQVNDDVQEPGKRPTIPGSIWFDPDIRKPAWFAALKYRYISRTETNIMHP